MLIAPIRGGCQVATSKFGCDIVILQESEMEDVNRPVVFDLWGRRSMDWLALPFVGRSGGIIVIWDNQIVKLVDSKVGTYAVYIKFKSLKDDFVWGAN